MYNMNPSNPTPVHSGTPYFMGEHALVKFSGSEVGFGPETYWLVDKNNRTLRPFESEIALHKAFGNGYDDAMRHVVVIKAPLVDENGEIMDGVLSDFSILTPDYSIKEDGSALPVEFSSYELKNRYGKPINEQAEEDAAQKIEGLISGLRVHPESSISPSFLDSLKNNDRLMAFYISAIAYGGYQLSDVHQDMIRRSNK